MAESISISSHNNQKLFQSLLLTASTCAVSSFWHVPGFQEYLIHPYLPEDIEDQLDWLNNCGLPISSKIHVIMNFTCNFAACQCVNRRQIHRDIGLATNAYQSLSPEEQDRADRDFYGTETSIVETYDFVESKLAELDRELGRICEEKKKCYTLAMDIERRLMRIGGEEYVGSKNFRLMFLRAELFDARLSAKRLIYYFKEKHDLFGEGALARRIKQVDLNEEEIMALHSGATNYVGTTDFAGRPVAICCRNNLLTLNHIFFKRICFYLFHKVIEDNEVAQKKGIVFIDYNMGSPIYPKPSILRESIFPAWRMAVHAIPFRLAACHNLYDDIKEHFIINLGLVVFPKIMRARFLAHYRDKHEECVAIFMTYGIDPDDLPLTDQGEVRYEMIRLYLETQRQLEQGKMV